MLNQFAVEIPTLPVDQKTCLSISRRPCPKERGDLLEKERCDLLSEVLRMHRLKFCWTDKKSEFLPSARQKLTDTNFKLKNFNDCRFWIFTLTSFPTPGTFAMLAA